MTRRPCLSAEAIADFIRGVAGEEDQRHVATCEDCSRRVAFLRRVDTAGIDRIADSAAEVDDLVARLLTARRHTWWRVVAEPEYRRSDVVRRLLRLALDARLRDRELAVDLTKATTSIADALAGGSREAADLRFEAWKLSSAVLRETGRYTECEAALVKAEEAAQAASDPELAHASVLLSRALFCAEPDVWRPEEASALLDRAEPVFARRDPSRMLAAMTTRGFLLFRLGELAAAREQFAAVLEATPTTDREAYLNALSNLIWPRVELGEADTEVERAIASLVDENAALGRFTAVAHAKWLLGKVRKLQGDYDSAVELLRNAMTGIGDSNASIRIGLDVIAALLLAGRHDTALAFARELASTAVALDQREPTRRRTLTADVFAYVREAAQRGVWTPELIDEVARYVDRITRQSPREFVPPMPLTHM